MTTNIKMLFEEVAGEIKTRLNPDGIYTFAEAKEILKAAGAYEVANG